MAAIIEIYRTRLIVFTSSFSIFLFFFFRFFKFHPMLLIGTIRDLVDQVFGISYLFRFARFITRYAEWIASGRVERVLKRERESAWKN